MQDTFFNRALGIISGWRRLAARRSLVELRRDIWQKRNEVVNMRYWKKQRKVLKDDESMLISSY